MWLRFPKGHLYSDFWGGGSWSSKCAPVCTGKSNVHNTSTSFHVTFLDNYPISAACTPKAVHILKGFCQLIISLATNLMIIAYCLRKSAYNLNRNREAPFDALHDAWNPPALPQTKATRNVCEDKGNFFFPFTPLCWSSAKTMKYRLMQINKWNW